MCKMKSCDRPSFIGGLCGYHALAGWSGPARAARKTAAAPVPQQAAVLPRRRAVARPASG
jgi:hypothetical protein